jgi:hypothetical protein
VHERRADLHFLVEGRLPAERRVRLRPPLVQVHQRPGRHRGVRRVAALVPRVVPERASDAAGGPVAKELVEDRLGRAVVLEVVEALLGESAVRVGRVDIERLRVVARDAEAEAAARSPEGREVDAEEAVAGGEIVRDVVGRRTRHHGSSRRVLQHPPHGPALRREVDRDFRPVLQVAQVVQAERGRELAAVVGRAGERGGSEGEKEEKGGAVLHARGPPPDARILAARTTPFVGCLHPPPAHRPWRGRCSAALLKRGLLVVLLRQVAHASPRRGRIGPREERVTAGNR